MAPENSGLIWSEIINLFVANGAGCPCGGVILGPILSNQDIYIIKIYICAKNGQTRGLYE